MTRSMSTQLWQKYNVTPTDTKWVDIGKAFEGCAMQICSRIVAKEFKSGGRPDLYAGSHPLEALKATISIAASHSPQSSLMHVDVSRAEASVLVKLLAEGCSGKEKRRNRTVEKEHVRYQRCIKQLGTKMARASGKLEVRTGAQFKKSVS